MADWNGEYISPHAYTGQPLPTDEDLRKDRPDDIPTEAKQLMTAMGIEFEAFDD